MIVQTIYNTLIPVLEKHLEKCLKKLRQTRSIQTEGHFGDIKENEDFRRFNYRTSDKVYKEFMLFAIGRNIN